MGIYSELQLSEVRGKARHCRAPTIGVLHSPEKRYKPHLKVGENKACRGF